MSASSISVRICNQKGLHARAAARFVRTAESFKSAITVRKGDTSVGATSIMGLMMLAAARGTELELSAEGPDSEAALNALKVLVERRFDEPE